MPKWNISFQHARCRSPSLESWALKRLSPTRKKRRHRKIRCQNGFPGSGSSRILAVLKSGLGMFWGPFGKHGNHLFPWWTVGMYRGGCSMGHGACMVKLKCFLSSWVYWDAFGYDVTNISQVNGESGSTEMGTVYNTRKVARRVQNFCISFKFLLFFLLVGALSLDCLSSSSKSSSSAFRSNMSFLDGWSKASASADRT